MSDPRIDGFQMTRQRSSGPERAYPAPAARGGGVSTGMIVLVTSPSDPIVVPGGTTTGASIKMMRVKRKMPEIQAACYDGTNAVQMAAWLLAMGRTARVDFQPNKPPLLINPATNAVIAPAWLLPNLEAVKDGEVGTVYDQIGEIEVVPITNTAPTPPTTP